MPTKLATAAFAFLLSFHSISAFAWGADGHRIAGRIAESYLTQEARIQINALSSGQSLADMSTYLDEERGPLMRQMPGSDKWHYEAKPICEQSSATQTCPSGNCATARIPQMQKLLADKNTPRETRIFALKALIHLVGDVHQPLHAADHHDHGGNDTHAGKYGLHSEWDTGLVKKLFRGQSAESYAGALAQKYSPTIPGVQKGAAADWVAESHDIAVKFVYGALPGFSCSTQSPSMDRLPQNYEQAAQPIIEKQLVKAGARVAYVLNQAFAR